MDFENRSKYNIWMGMTGHRIWALISICLMIFGTVVAFLGSERCIDYYESEFAPAGLNYLYPPKSYENTLTPSNEAIKQCTVVQ